MAGYQVSRSMHLRLYRFLGENMPQTSREFKDFFHHVPLTPRDKADKDDMEGLLQIWESRGGISLGDYDELIRVLREADLSAMVAEIEQMAEKIKKQLEIENIPDPAVRQLPDPPPDHPQNNEPDYKS